jgi:hypothetical protein
MSSTIGVQNIAHTNGTVAATVSSGGVVTFTSDPFNNVIETFYYDSTDRVHTDGVVLNQAWTRQTANQTANKNSGMSASSGIFTFPSTGVWRTELDAQFITSQSSTYAGFSLYFTANNSSYTQINARYNGNTAGAMYMSVNMPYTFNITDTSNQKIRFNVSAQHQITIRGGSTHAGTKLHFIKLCPST